MPGIETSTNSTASPEWVGTDFWHAGADAWRDEAWQVIRDCDRLTWLILTKRPELIADRLPPDWGNGWPHVWLGTTVGCRASLHRLDTLRDIPAALRFVSAEPLLEAVDFAGRLDGFGWVITGCEQAHRDKRRKMDRAWNCQIDETCFNAGVPHFFKQAYDTDVDGNEVGTPNTTPKLSDVTVQEFPIPPSKTWSITYETPPMRSIKRCELDHAPTKDAARHAFSKAKPSSRMRSLSLVDREAEVSGRDDAADTE